MKPGYYFVFGALIAGSFFLWLFYNKREHYGAMKNIKKIPFNDCVALCNGLNRKCALDNVEADPSWCDRLNEACESQCYYTSYHQLQG